MNGVTTEIATRRRTGKENAFKKKIGSRHHIYLWKTMENHKIKKVCEKPNFGSGSRLRVGKVLAPYAPVRGRYL